MKIKYNLLILSLMTSLSCYAAQEPSTPAPQTNSSTQTPKQSTVAKPSMADFCKKHTC